MEYLIKDTTLEEIADIVREGEAITDKIPTVELANRIRTLMAKYKEEGIKSVVEKTVESISSDTKTLVTTYEFHEFKNLKSIDFPNVTTINSYAFLMCSNLEEINCPKLTSLGTYAFSQAGTIYINKPGFNVDFSLVTSIPERCFYSAGLRRVNIPKVTSIGNYAFADSDLNEITMPMVKTLGTSAFDNCDYLISIDLPLVTSLPTGAFYACAKLQEVNIPLVTTIGTSAFEEATKLAKLYLPKVTTINTYAFAGSNLSTLVIGNKASVCTLKSANAFYYKDDDDVFTTPIKTGTGYIYVPKSLIESYKVATNWKTYANQFRAIEDYYNELVALFPDFDYILEEVA